MIDLNSGHQISTKHIYVPIFEDYEPKNTKHKPNPDNKMLKPGKPKLIPMQISNDDFTLQKVFNYDAKKAKFYILNGKNGLRFGEKFSYLAELAPVS